MTDPKQVDFPQYIPPFVGRENVKHVASVSGGKDSGSVYLMLLELTGGDFVAAFAGTGNEHPATLEYVSRLHERTGGATRPDRQSGLCGGIGAKKSASELRQSSNAFQVSLDAETCECCFAPWVGACRHSVSGPLPHEGDVSEQENRVLLAGIKATSSASAGAATAY